MTDSSDLNRFLIAQNLNNLYEIAHQELQNGQKVGHWMWFIFPQLRGPGSSEKSIFYGIASRNEALSYLQHKVLGKRLSECVQLVMQIPHRDMDRTLGIIDARKLCSCMTLFELAATSPVQQEPFQKVLENLYGGMRDPQTIALWNTLQ